MGTLSGIGHPSIYRPSVTATSSATHQGPGPASLLGATVGWIVPPIWSPFWKRGGAVLSHRFSVRNKSTEAAGQPWCRNLSSHRGSRTTLRGTSRRRTGFAKQWRGMLRRAKRRRSSGNFSKSASTKISTASSLVWISTRKGASPKSTSCRRPLAPRMMA
jgi:hypothetical protein